jgi:CheY-like chemotaxis protein
MTIPAEIGKPPASGGSDRKLRILLVEDHADTAVILTRLLKKMGHDVVAAQTVAGACDAAASEMAAGGIDLVISDLGLPDGSGLDLMRQLSSAYGLCGVALSGFGRDEDIELSLAAGFSRHLTKPINVLLLRKTISELTPET